MANMSQLADVVSGFDGLVAAVQSGNKGQIVLELKNGVLAAQSFLSLLEAGNPTLIKALGVAGSIDAAVISMTALLQDVNDGNTSGAIADFAGLVGAGATIIAITDLDPVSKIVAASVSIAAIAVKRQIELSFPPTKIADSPTAKPFFTDNSTPGQLAPDGSPIDVGRTNGGISYIWTVNAAGQFVKTESVQTIKADGTTLSGLLSQYIYSSAKQPISGTSWVLNGLGEAIRTIQLVPSSSQGWAPVSGGESSAQVDLYYSSTWADLGSDAANNVSSNTADGASATRTSNPSGSYAITTDDGANNISTDYYTKNGNLIEASWVHSDGSSGTEVLFNDGQLASSTGGPSSSSFEITTNPNGSFQTESIAQIGTSSTNLFSSTGGQSGSASTQAGTQDFNKADAEKDTEAAGPGGTRTEYTSKSGTWLGEDWTVYDPNTGKLVTSGSDTVHASGEVTGKINNADGTSQTFSLYGTPGGPADSIDIWSENESISDTTGKRTKVLHSIATNGPVDLTYDNFNAAGVLTGDNWQLADGSSGNSSLSPDGSGTSTITRADGSSSTTALSADGTIVVNNVSAGGAATSEDWWHADGAHGVNIFGLSGAQTNYAYAVNGTVSITEIAEDGTTTSLPSEQAGALINPDFSNFGKVQSPDGGYSLNYTDAYGDSEIFQYAVSGALTGTDHVSAARVPVGGWSSTLSDGSTAASQINEDTLQSTAADGTQYTYYLDNTGNETGDDFVDTDGSHGTDTYNSDGSWVEQKFNADGSSTSYQNDGNGGFAEQFFGTNGAEGSDLWQGDDGSHGYDDFNSDGSSNGTAFAADGTYSEYALAPNGSVTNGTFTAAGHLISETWTLGDGTSGAESFGSDGSGSSSTYTAVGVLQSTTAIDATGGEVVEYYDPSTGILSGDSWTKADGSHGTEQYSYTGFGSLLDPIITGTAYNADGSITAYTSDPWFVFSGTTTYANGDYLTFSQEDDGAHVPGVLPPLTPLTPRYLYNASGVLKSRTWWKFDNTDTPYQKVVSTYDSTGTLVISDAWSNVDGSATGTDVYNADGSSTGASINSDGTSSSYTNAGEGTIDSKYFSAAGSQTGTSATVTDSSGDSITKYYDLNGLLTNDSWIQKPNVYTVVTGSDIYAADGSSTGSFFTQTGSLPSVTTYSTVVNDGKGNETTDTFSSPAGLLLGDSWTLANGASGNDTYGADGTVTHSSSTGGVQTINPDGSYTTASTNAGGVTTNFYSVAGSFTGSTVTQTSAGKTTTASYAGVNGTGALLGDQWTATDGTHGSDSYSGGSSSSTSYAIDGSYTTETTSANGDTETYSYNASGVLTGDSWSKLDGSFGNDYYSPSGTLASATIQESSHTLSVGNTVPTVVVGQNNTITISTGGDALAIGQGGTTINAGADTDVEIDSSGSDILNVSNDRNGSATSHGVNTSGISIFSNGVNYLNGSNDDVSMDSGGETLIVNGQSNSIRTSGDIIEFIGDSTGDVVIGTNNTVKYKVTNSDGTSTVSGTGPAGTTIEQYSTLDALTADTWTKVDGSHGSDAFSSDGSSIKTDVASGGTSTTTITDAQGNVVVDEYSAAGTLTGDSWSQVSGIHGTDSFNGNGSSNGTTYQASGNYASYTNDGNGNITTDYYSNSNVLLSDSWTMANGSYGNDTYNADGSIASSTSSVGIRSSNSDGSYSITATDAGGDVAVSDYSAAGVLTGDSWTQVNGSFGGDTYNADGSSTGEATNADGSYSTSSLDVSGNQQTNDYSAGGVWYADSWSDAAGDHGTDSDDGQGNTTTLEYDADGSSDLYYSYSDGSTKETRTDAQDNVDELEKFANGSSHESWTDAQGDFSEEHDLDNSGGNYTFDYQNADGSHGDSYNDGQGDSYAENIYADGRMDHGWTHADGSSYNDSTDAEGNFESNTNSADDSFSHTSSDASGNSRTDNYSSDGELMTSNWAGADGSSGTDTFDSDGTISSSNVNFGTAGSSITLDNQGVVLNSVDVAGTTSTVRLGNGSNQITMGDGNDQIQVGSGTNEVTVGNGDDTVSLGFPGETGSYQVSVGNGSDTINTYGGSNLINFGSGQYQLHNVGGTDSVTLGSGGYDKLWFQVENDNLTISVLGTDETITLNSWSGGSQLSELTSSDGHTISGSDISQLVQAMASFAPPTSGQTSYTAQEQQALAPLMATSWH